MLTLNFGAGERDCSGIARRDFLRVGAMGLGALTLPEWLRLRAGSSRTGESFIHDRAVVFLYLSGGASHIETFNPNMDAPAPYKSLTGEVKTSVPGLTFGGTFPRLAKHAHRLAIIKSFRHPVGGHEQAHVHVLSGGTDPRGDNKAGYSIGSVATKIRGANHPQTGLPTYSLLTHAEIDGQYRKELGRVRKGSWPGPFGANYGPFEHQGEETSEESKRGKKKRLTKKKSSKKGDGSLTADLVLNIEPERLERRRGLLDSLDRLRARVETRPGERRSALGTVDGYREQAFDLMLGKGAKAFDLSEESPELLARYDTSHVMIGHRAFRKSTLGHQMLTARRLVEAGCGFVTVHSAGWDMHADGNNPPMVKGMNMLGRTLDQALSVFLEDVADRGLTDKILLVVTGDFGRTPKINNRGGRDHWANLGPLMFSGGGLPGGAVVGRSDRRNAEPNSEPVTPGDMMGTILHSLFDVGEMRVARGVPRDLLAIVENTSPIPGL